jgi:hypothetical protein
MQRAMEGPLAQFARLQEQRDRALGAPARRALEQQQRAMHAALQGPLSALGTSQERIRRLLDGPIQELQRNQEAMTAALAGPYAAIARNQDLMRAVMEAAAAAAAAAEAEDDASAPDAEQIAWLEEWSAAVAEWAPTWEQVEFFLSALALLLAIIVYAAGQTDTEVAHALLEPAGILCAAGALLINRVRY